MIGRMSDVVDELVAAVETARASTAQADADHKRVKDLLVQARIQRPDLGPGDLEALIGKYMDQAVISRITVPEMRKLGHEPTRKPTRRRSRT